MSSRTPSYLTYFREPWQDACPFSTIGKDSGRYFVADRRIYYWSGRTVPPVSVIFSLPLTSSSVYSSHVYFSKPQLLTSPSEVSRENLPPLFRTIPIYERLADLIQSTWSAKILYSRIPSVVYVVQKDIFGNDLVHG